ncbi:hypothetical protein [Sutcliffiella horikoshii]|uniref:Uncharacterized protein n=1 Tax=Sutcliffiella horikoshii TaxID=79883 RepID=A0A5D4TCY6_9BACI|nr:hypothetical protein [Sutcliffiella horikoshii]TYS72372.1 hypothetical protein FZC75_10480 [Sutcliffiella horikoshii]
MSENINKVVEEFIVCVARACYKSDKSCVHILADTIEGIVYRPIPKMASNKTPRKVDPLIICRIDGDMIEDLSKEAGKEYYSQEWLEYVIKQLVKGEFYISYLRYKRKVRQNVQKEW